MMRLMRSELGSCVGIGLLGALMAVAVSCSDTPPIVELESIVNPSLPYEPAALTESALAKRMKEIDQQYAEPRTPAGVKLSRETSLHSISSVNNYGALWRGARACAWLANHSTRGEQEAYAKQGVWWGKEAVSKAKSSVHAESYYYYGLNLKRLFEIRRMKPDKLALRTKEHLSMAYYLDSTLDHCGPARELGELLVATREYPLLSIGTAEEGMAYLRQATEECPQFGGNHLAYAGALLEIGDFDGARAALDQLMALPSPPDHSADHVEWLAQASRLYNDLPGK